MAYTHTRHTQLAFSKIVEYNLKINTARFIFTKSGVPVIGSRNVAILGQLGWDVSLSVRMRSRVAFGYKSTAAKAELFHPVEVSEKTTNLLNFSCNFSFPNPAATMVSWKCLLVKRSRVLKCCNQLARRHCSSKCVACCLLKSIRVWMLRWLIKKSWGKHLCLCEELSVWYTI